MRANSMLAQWEMGNRKAALRFMTNTGFMGRIDAGMLRYKHEVQARSPADRTQHGVVWSVYDCLRMQDT